MECWIASACAVRHELGRDEQPILWMWNREVAVRPQDHVIVLAQVDDASIRSLRSSKEANLEGLEP